LTNPATSLDAIKNKNLEGPLSLADFTSLRELDLTGNKITRLDMNNCPNLQVIRCDNNPITNLRFINRNKFTTIEISLSQDELLRDKDELKRLNEKLEKQITDLEKDKASLGKRIVELKDLNKRDEERLKRERDSRPNITLER